MLFRPCVELLVLVVQHRSDVDSDHPRSDALHISSARTNATSGRGQLLSITIRSLVRPVRRLAELEGSQEHLQVCRLIKKNIENGFREQRMMESKDKTHFLISENVSQLHKGQRKLSFSLISFNALVVAALAAQRHPSRRRFIGFVRRSTWARELPRRNRRPRA